MSIDSQILTIAFRPDCFESGGLPPLYHKEDGMCSQILVGVSGNCLRVSTIMWVERGTSIEKGSVKNVIKREPN